MSMDGCCLAPLSTRAGGPFPPLPNYGRATHGGCRNSLMICWTWRLIPRTRW
jgi:hypothetical protein